MSSCKECLTCLGYLISVLSLLAGAIAYFVFGIIYLIEDYEISNECKGSNLWEYVLVSLILSTGNISIKSENQSNETLVILMVVIGIFNLCLSTWGSIELWKYSYSCDDLFNSNLWKVGLASFIIQIITTLICVIFPPILLWYMRYIESRNINSIPELTENKLNLKINTNV